MVREGIVLGHLVSERGIEVDKEKIEVIERPSPPTNVKRNLKLPRTLRVLSAIRCQFLPNRQTPDEPTCPAANPTPLPPRIAVMSTRPTWQADYLWQPSIAPSLAKQSQTHLDNLQSLTQGLTTNGGGGTPAVSVMCLWRHHILHLRA